MTIQLIDGKPVRIASKDQFISLTRDLELRADWKDSDEKNVQVKIFGHEFNSGGAWGHAATVNPDVVQQYAMVYQNNIQVAEVNLCSVFGYAVESPVVLDIDGSSKEESIAPNPIFEDFDTIAWLCGIFDIEDRSDIEVTQINGDCAHVFVHGPRGESEANNLLYFHEGDIDKLILVNAYGKHEHLLDDPEAAYNEMLQKVRDALDRGCDLSEFYDVLKRIRNHNMDIPSAETIFQESMENNNHGNVNWRELSDDLGFDVDDVLYENIKENFDSQGDDSLLRAAESHFSYGPQDLFDEMSEHTIDAQDLIAIAHEVLKDDDLDEHTLETVSKYKG